MMLIMKASDNPLPLEVKVKFPQVLEKGILRVLNDVLTLGKILLHLSTSKAITRDRHNGNLRTENQICQEFKKIRKSIVMPRVKGSFDPPMAQILLVTPMTLRILMLWKCQSLLLTWICKETS